MTESWWQALDPLSLLVGALAGLLIGAVAGILAWRSGQARLARRDQELAEARTELAVARSRLQAQEEHFGAQVAALEAAEKRMGETFERLAGKELEGRSQKLHQLNARQLDSVLKPLGERLQEFNRTVSEAHKQEVAQHEVLKAKLAELERLNERLHDDAENLTRALTRDVKAQGNWGEQQLERLLELAGLERGREFSTQVSVTTESGHRLQPDLVLHIPGEKSIVMDSKVSLTAWTRLQAAEDDTARETLLREHVQSLRGHIRGLGEKRYAEVPELNALDFVLMFVPIEGALIAALRADPELPAFALEHRVALMSPTNLVATTRTVASIWSIHRQNTHARDIASRAGLLYDKFVGFVDSLEGVGSRLRQAQQSYEQAFSQLSTGAGNLVRQAEMLRELGARHSKQLESTLAEHARESDDDDDAEVPAGLRLVERDGQD